jgi:hypothetical protein
VATRTFAPRSAPTVEAVRTLATAAFTPVPASTAAPDRRNASSAVARHDPATHRAPMYWFAMPGAIAASAQAGRTGGDLIAIALLLAGAVFAAGAIAVLIWGGRPPGLATAAVPYGGLPASRAALRPRSAARSNLLAAARRSGGNGSGAGTAPWCAPPEPAPERVSPQPEPAPPPVPTRDGLSRPPEPPARDGR